MTHRFVGFEEFLNRLRDSHINPVTDEIGIQLPELQRIYAADIGKSLELREIKIGIKINLGLCVVAQTLSSTGTGDRRRRPVELRLNNGLLQLFIIYS